MIPSVSNPIMTTEDICRFRKEMSRKIRGEFTAAERERYDRARRVYAQIISNNGGKNPILSD